VKTARLLTVFLKMSQKQNSQRDPKRSSKLLQKKSLAMEQIVYFHLSFSFIQIF